MCGLSYRYASSRAHTPRCGAGRAGWAQWGVVSLAQFGRWGSGRAAVTAAGAGGRLRRVHRGVYAVGGAVLPREGRWLAAVLACGPRAVLSHVSAAVHWNLLNYEPAAPRGHRPRVPQGRPGDPPAPLSFPRCPGHHQPPRHPDHHRAPHAARHRGPSPKHHLERALAQAERLQLYDHRAIESVIERSNGHRGTRRLATAIQDDPQFTRGELEARMRKLVRDHGLPRPSFNVSLDAPDHPGLEVDCYFPTHRLVVETDGWDTHRTRQAFEDDRAKDAALLAAGYRVVRFTWRQLRYDPQTVADRLTAILALHAPPAPPGTPRAPTRRSSSRARAPGSAPERTSSA